VSQQNGTPRHEAFRRNETDAIVVCQSPAAAWTCSQTFGRELLWLTGEALDCLVCDRSAGADVGSPAEYNSP